MKWVVNFFSSAHGVSRVALNVIFNLLHLGT